MFINRFNTNTHKYDISDTYQNKYFINICFALNIMIVLLGRAANFGVEFRNVKRAQQQIEGTFNVEHSFELYCVFKGSE